MVVLFKPKLNCIECDYRRGVKQIGADSVVRNELNGWRALHDPDQVIQGYVEGPKKPNVMPRPFPKGEWELYQPWPRSEERNPYLAPFFVPTSAHQEVEIWALDEDGGYDHPTGEMVDTIGYGLHYSELSKTTVGCIRIWVRNDLLWFVNVLTEELERGRESRLIYQ